MRQHPRQEPVNRARLTLIDNLWLVVKTLDLSYEDTAMALSMANTALLKHVHRDEPFVPQLVNKDEAAPFLAAILATQQAHPDLTGPETLYLLAEYQSSIAHRLMRISRERKSPPRRKTAA